MKKIFKMLPVLLVLSIMFTGCDIAQVESSLNDLSGNITGNTYDCQFYTNEGELIMTASGSNINMTQNVIREYGYDSDGNITCTKTPSSVITVTIDGSQIESCGSTIVFAEKGLNPEVSFNTENINIESESQGLSDMAIIAKTVNQFKNSFGKPVVVVIQSQLGDPICAYSGDDVYWEICNNLPKTTKLMIDGKALYIHRANFQIIDKDLL